MMMQLVERKIDKKVAANALHVTAANRFRQWIVWHKHCMPLIKRRETAALTRIMNGNLPAYLRKIVSQQSEQSVRLLSEVIGPFPRDCRSDILVENRLIELRVWVRLANGQPAYDQRQWRTLAESQFIALPHTKQLGFYRQAVDDISVVADEAGLILPDLLPLAEPLAGRQSRMRIWRHKIGLHGDYVVSEEAWSTTCQACNRTRGFEHYGY